MLAIPRRNFRSLTKFAMLIIEILIADLMKKVTVKERVSWYWNFGAKQLKILKKLLKIQHDVYTEKVYIKPACLNRSIYSFDSGLHFPSSSLNRSCIVLTFARTATQLIARSLGRGSQIWLWLIWKRWWCWRGRSQNVKRLGFNILQWNSPRWGCHRPSYQGESPTIYPYYIPSRSDWCFLLLEETCPL